MEDVLDIEWQAQRQVNAIVSRLRNQTNTIKQLQEEVKLLKQKLKENKNEY